MQVSVMIVLNIGMATILFLVLLILAASVWMQARTNRGLATASLDATREAFIHGLIDFGRQTPGIERPVSVLTTDTMRYTLSLIVREELLKDEVL